MGHYPRRGRAAGAALDSFADVYADRAIAAEILLERVIEGSAHYEPAMRYVPLPAQWVSVVGFDLVRNPDGEFVVLEDQIRMPSGLGYALSAREVLPAALGVLPAERGRVGDHGPAWGDAAGDRAEEATTPLSLSCRAAGRRRVVRARADRPRARVPVVTLDQLRGDDDELNARVNRRPRRIDVVYQRTDEDRSPTRRESRRRSGRRCWALQVGECRALTRRGPESATTSSCTPTLRRWCGSTSARYLS